MYNQEFMYQQPQQGQNSYAGYYRPPQGSMAPPPYQRPKFNKSRQFQMMNAFGPGGFNLPFGQRNLIGGQTMQEPWRERWMQPWNNTNRQSAPPLYQVQTT